MKTFLCRSFAVFLAMASSVASPRAQVEKLASATSELELFIKASKKDQVRHSMMGPRNTLLFYTFATQKAVLAVQLDNKNSTVTASGTLHIFDPSATEDSISKWVNNQHSDGLFVDAATPALSLKLPDGILTAKDRKFISREKQSPGDEVFSDYQVKIMAKEHRVEGKYRLYAFTDEANIFVKDD